MKRGTAISILLAVIVTVGCLSGGVTRAGTVAISDQATRTGSFQVLNAVPSTAVPARPDAERMSQKFAELTGRAAQLQLQLPESAVSKALSSILRMPKTKSRALAIVNPGFTGFDSISDLGSGLLNGFLLEPPDQGVCVGGGLVVEVVNLALEVFTTAGAHHSGPFALSSVFGVPTADFIADPRCVFDADNETFYLTATDIFSGFTKSKLLLGVLPVSSGTATTYTIITTDDGSNGITHTGCPCAIDQPYLGLDSHAVFIVGNEFSLGTPAILGSQIYAVRREDVAALSLSAGAVIFQNPIALAEGTAMHLSPAWSPKAQFETRNGGTEYLLSALDFHPGPGVLDNRLGLYAVFNTCGIHSSTITPCGSTPTLTPAAVGHSNVYGQPRKAPEPGENGSTILDLGTATDQMQQVVFSRGNLYGALATILTVNGEVRDGIDWFMIHPSVSVKSDKVHGGVRSAYVANELTDLFYPSITANASGKVMVGFDMSSETRVPSTGYTALRGFSGKQEIHIAGMGFDPYLTVAQRWGDYSAATVDESGNFWFAGEYVPPLGEQTVIANWGTFIAGVVP